jgi:hypothetical protein
MERPGGGVTSRSRDLVDTHVARFSRPASVAVALLQSHRVAHCGTACALLGTPAPCPMPTCCMYAYMH